MVNFRKFSISLFGILTLLLISLFTSCDTEKDFSWPDDGQKDPDDSDTIHVLRTHTEGQGIPIVIMADGYTASDISDGTYRKAILRADTALFSMEPMKSLKQYFDVIEVAVPSSESGIGTKKKNTAFKTYYDSSNSTEIHGDSVTIESWAKRAIIQAYGVYSSAAITEKFNKLQIITLINSSEYKGITLLACDNTVTDSIPAGFSLSYIPTNAKYNKRDVFTDLVQHEAVGHGIGKLADEYFEPSDVSPTSKDLAEFLKLQKYGCMMNAAYDTEAAEDKYYGIYRVDSMYLYLFAHPFYSTDMAYPLTLDSRYASEDIAWYQGGYTYLTYTNDRAPHTFALLCKKEFYRPSMYSTMNATTNTNNKTFNVVSRLAIYKRVMRAAFGSSFTCDLHNADDLEAFAQFDAPARTAASGAKSAISSGVQSVAYCSNDAPTLAPPVFIESPKF